MSCFHPLKAFPIGKTVNGKIQYKVTPYNVDHLELNKNGTWVKVYDHFIAASKQIQKTFIEVPCGQCVGCRLDKSKEWANRCMMELNYHEESWFITLTYDDEHVPWSESYDTDTGEQRSAQTLVKKDFQDFMKRLRKNYKYDNKLRFYMAGEYGSSSCRPHYHAIIFGLKLDDLQVYSQSSQGFTYYNSNFLDNCWHKGFVVAAKVTWETCAYTARYIMKKLNGDQAKVYSEWNIQPEFTLMSRKPGIAKQYFDDHKNCMEYDQISVVTEKGGLSFKPPRYFDKLYDIEYPQHEQTFYEKLNSQSQQISNSIKSAKLDRTSLEYTDYLKSAESAKKAQIKSLTRKGV